MGDWTVIVKDSEVNDFSGEFIDWRFNLWGEAVDGTTQGLHPLPDEHDDDHPYEEAHVATTTLEPGPSKTNPSVTNPDEHHDRPVNQKPTDQPSAPTVTQPADEELEVVNNGTTAGSAASSTSTAVTDNYLSSYLPTFGASKRTQVWIYASLGMIIVFFIGLGVFFQLQRLKRRRTDPQDDYEFEMIEDEDEMHPMTGPGGRSQRRGGELYNAFAGESDEEIFSEDEEEKPYRDRLANIPERDDEESSPGSHLLSEKH